MSYTPTYAQYAVISMPAPSIVEDVHCILAKTKI